MKHQKVDDDGDRPGLTVESSDDEDSVTQSMNQRKLQARQVRRAVLDHFRFAEEPGGCGINTHDGSVAVLPPGADEAGSRQLYEQDVRGQKADQPKPLSSLSKGHPGPRYKESDLQARDLRWVDIGSGVVSRVFPRATRLMTTSKGGPCMADIHSRRVWSLTTGRLLDECDVQNTSDEVMNRALPHEDNIRVELVLRNALELYERKGPDVSEIFSQPRICQEVSGRTFNGETLRPGWSLDLTTLDPATGERWDLSRPEVQSRVKRLIRTTQPLFVVGSPPCTPFSPLQEISRAKRDANVMAEELRRGKAHIRFCLEIYAMQLSAKRHFIHEHPERSKAWDMPEVKQFFLRPEVDAVTIHMCAFGMTAVDEIGEAPVQKATRIMSSSAEVLKRID